MACISFWDFDIDAEEVPAPDFKIPVPSDCKWQLKLDRKHSDFELHEAMTARMDKLMKQCFGPQWHWTLQSLTFVGEQKTPWPPCKYKAVLLGTDRPGFAGRGDLIKMFASDFHETMQHAWGWMLWKLESFLYYRAVIAGLLDEPEVHTKREECPVYFVARACAHQEQVAARSARKISVSRSIVTKIGYLDILVEKPSLASLRERKDARISLNGRLAQLWNTVNERGLMIELWKREDRADSKALRRQNLYRVMLDVHHTQKQKFVAKRRRRKFHGKTMLRLHHRCKHLYASFKDFNRRTRPEVSRIEYPFDAVRFFVETFETRIGRAIARAVWPIGSEALMTLSSTMHEIIGFVQEKINKLQETLSDNLEIEWNFSESSDEYDDISKSEDDSAEPQSTKISKKGDPLVVSTGSVREQGTSARCKSSDARVLDYLAKVLHGSELENKRNCRS